MKEETYDDVSDGRIVLEFLATILYNKNLITHSDYLAIGDAKNIGDLDRIIDGLGD